MSHRRIGCLALCLTLTLLAPAAADDKPVELLRGADLAGWKFRGDPSKSKWVVGRAALDPKDGSRLLAMRADREGERELVNPERGVDIYTEEKFADCTLEIECMVPRGSNSGIYLMGEYEVQILDSHGKKEVGPGDLGGIYNTAAPRVNAARKPGEWQKFVIEFQAPRFKDGQKVANARFRKVTLNDQVLHENVEVKGPTTAALTGKESPTGPLMLQGDHGPVAFRNLRLTPHPAK